MKIDEHVGVFHALASNKLYGFPKNITMKYNGTFIKTFTYNADGQLASTNTVNTADPTFSHSESFGYDSAGNLIKYNNSEGLSATFSY